MSAIPARETLPMVDEPMRPQRSRSVARAIDLLMRSLAVEVDRDCVARLA